MEHSFPFKALVRAAGDNEQWLKILCFTSSKKGSLTPRFFTKAAEGFLPLLIIMVTLRVAGAEGWVIHQKMVFTDLDYVHCCSPPFMCLIKSWLGQNKWKCNSSLELSGEKQKFCREKEDLLGKLHYHFPVTFPLQSVVTSHLILKGQKAGKSKNIFLKWWYRSSSHIASSSFYQRRNKGEELWLGWYS